jgi:hypothetical protein
MAKTALLSNGGHLGYRTALTDTILKGDHLRIISARFGWDWLNSFTNLNCISIMMSFLTYITGFFYELWTFADFDRLCKLEKRGDGIKKILLLWNYLAFWLKIEQFWPFEEISIFNNGGHLGYRTALMDTILKGDHPRIISAKFGWDWLSSFRGEEFFFKLVSVSTVLYPRWPPLLKIEISSNGQKLLYFMPESAQIGTL